MESHIKFDDDHMSFKPEGEESSKEWFRKAYDFSNKYYSHEIQRASAVKWDDITPDLFFREYIWVVHATGFSAKAVSKFIDRLINAYGSFDILSDDEQFLNRVLPVCNNPQKANAVKKTAGILKNGIDSIGWDEWKNENISKVDLLSKLPYIGNITKYHLGRNIGMLDSVKPDLHFVRMSHHWEYSSSEEMIKDMSVGYPIPLGIADMIAWYYASTFGTLYMKKGDVR